MNITATSDLDSFVAEFKAETDRGLPLVAAAVIDEKLLNTLKAFLCVGKAGERLLTEHNAPLGTFAARIDACRALGLIDDFEYQECNLIRKIRNEFAHKTHGLSFKTASVQSLCMSLKSVLPPGSSGSNNDPRARFMMAAITLAIRLYYRDTFAAKDQRQVGDWESLRSKPWRPAGKRRKK